MIVAQKSTFNIVIDALQESATLLKNQQKEEAKNTISRIASEIEFLSETSQKREDEFQERQRELTKQIQNIMQEEAAVRQAALNTQASIRDVNQQIEGKRTNKQQLEKALASASDNLAANQRQLAKHQKKWDRLNDDSAGSIVLSIFTLGIDRAVMGIESLVNKDKQRIAALKPEIDRYRKDLQQSRVSLEQTEQLLKQLKRSKASSEAAVRELDRRQKQLHSTLKTCKDKAAFFTDVALFYGKLVVIANQVDHRIDDIEDIIAELDDSNPTIVDFDGSGEDVISLKDALTKFDSFLDDNPASREVQISNSQMGGIDGLVGIFSEDGNHRLDIGTRMMKQSIPATHDSWATRLIIKRLDGPNTGPVLQDHVIGIFGMNGQHRLDIGTRSMKEVVPASHESWATRLRIVPLSRVGTGPIQYNEVVGIFSEDKKWRLDIGTAAVKESVSASHESWATRLKFESV